MKKRIVITGLGAITSHGDNPEEIWRKIQEGKSAIDKIDNENINSRCEVGAEIKDFNLSEELLSKKEQRRTDRAIHLAMYSAYQAIQDSKYEKHVGNQYRIGNIVGTGFGGSMSLLKNYENFLKKDEKLSAFPSYSLTQSLHNMIPGYISIKNNIKGVSYSVSSACASGAHAIEVASKYIEDGSHDIVVCTGVEAALNKLGILAFSTLRALSTSFNENPQEASRPFSKTRDGFVMAEGSVSLILEDYEHALKRGAKIYGELVEAHSTTDAKHLVAPDESLRAVSHCMKEALSKARIDSQEINYINAHATSTPTGDILEAKAIEEVFGKEVLVNSTKSSTGHLLGAAGSLESMVCLLSLRDSVVAPTINTEDLDEECLINIVKVKKENHKMTYALNNSFGFGGTNCCLIFKKYEGQ